MTASALPPLPSDALRWRRDEGAFAFETTADLPDLEAAPGQERASEALRFGARMSSPSHHVFAMGDPAMDWLPVVLQSLARESGGRPVPRDWCYINRFDDPRRLAARSRRFRQADRGRAARGARAVRTAHRIRGVVGELKAEYSALHDVAEYLAEVERDLIENAQLFRQEERPAPCTGRTAATSSSR